MEVKEQDRGVVDQGDDTVSQKEAKAQVEQNCDGLSQGPGSGSGRRGRRRPGEQGRRAASAGYAVVIHQASADFRGWVRYEGPNFLNRRVASGLAWTLIVLLLYGFDSASSGSLESEPWISQIILQLFSV